MNLPSLNSLVKKSTVTFSRFPLTILFAITGAGYVMRLLHLPFDEIDKHYGYWNVVNACYLGMLLSIVATVHAERMNLSAGGKIIFQVSVLAVIGIYFYLLPDHFMIISLLRLALFSIGLHLAIAFVPFLGSGRMKGFWQYNKILLLRILTSALYSAVLFLGLFLAILAVDQLFKAHINEKLYGDLWIFIAGVFNTWFFLAGFPSDYSSLESETSYPKGLKIFTQYILIPLITVYLLILYAYMFKIIITMQWPVGWVSYLVLGFSIGGILSLLLIHPVRNDEDNKWMLAFSRFFYFAIFPLIVLLFLAIKRRISDYGITENRYFVLMLALWLVFIAAYFLISRTKNIKLIPVSLCFVAFLSSFGPWGAFSVSLRSQKKHLGEILQKNNLLDNGKIKKVDAKISFEDHKEISSVIEYITEVHGYENLQSYFSQNLDSLMKKDSTTSMRYSYAQVNRILEQMNLAYVGSYQTDLNETQVNYNAGYSNLVNIAGYDYFIHDFYMTNHDTKENVCSSYSVGSNPLNICFDPEKNRLFIPVSPDSLLFDIPLLFHTLRDKNYTMLNDVKQEDFSLTSANEKFAVMFLFKNIVGTRHGDTLDIARIQADILIQVKREKVNEVGERNQ